MTHTDRKSAEILAALDKLAENGMPFIDVVKRDGFSGFHAKGVQPLPTEPVQVHEDHGAAYWKEATKMAEHADRIKQMAQEAGASFDQTFESVGANPAFIMSPEELTRFAQLVAEDCARVGDLYGMPDGASTAAIHIAEAIRARYSLATPSQAG